MTVKKSRRIAGIAISFLIGVLTVTGNAFGATGGHPPVKPYVPNLQNIPAKIIFGKATTPSPLPAQSIGFYAAGCLAGGVELPATDPQSPPAWQVMRPSRNRAWGNPKLISFIERMARQAKTAGDWPGLLVGDISQPRGGPMLNGHASHQIGLDVDIWLTPMPDHILTTDERENMVAKLMVISHYDVDPRNWTDAQAKLLQRFARDPEVVRIFVHPPIKKALCAWAKGDRTWLAKIRPYYGHDWHFHVRVRCPPGSPSCDNQNEPSPKDGTGCGEELSSWLSPTFWSRHRQGPPTNIPFKPNPLPTLSSLPKACGAVLKN